MRESEGIAIDTLAVKVGLSPQTVYSYEQGKIRIPWDKVIAICRALGWESGGLANEYEQRWFYRHRPIQLPVRDFAS